MVEFKTIKYKHYRKALQLTAAEDAGEDAGEEHFRFLLSLVSSWDFTDEDTGEPLSPGLESIDELTVEQLNEVTETFNQIFSQVSTVPKTNAGHSLSTSTEKPQAERPKGKTSPTGYPPYFSPEGWG